MTDKVTLEQAWELYQRMRKCCPGIKSPFFLEPDVKSDFTEIVQDFVDKWRTEGNKYTAAKYVEATQQRDAALYRLGHLEDVLEDIRESLRDALSGEPEGAEEHPLPEGWWTCIKCNAGNSGNLQKCGNCTRERQDAEENSST